MTVETEGIPLATRRSANMRLFFHRQFGWSLRENPGARNVIAVLLGVVVAGWLTVAMTVPSAAEATSGSPMWSLAATVPYPPINTVGTSCPLTTKCYALSWTDLGDELLRVTNDGGSSWVDVPIPTPANGHFQSLACPSASTCLVVGEDGGGQGVAEVTTDGGAHWRSGTINEQTPGLTVLSCPSVLVCTAAGYQRVGSTITSEALVRTTDGGSTWSGVPVPSGLALTGISCPSVRNCVATGYTGSEDPSGGIVSTRNGESSWSVDGPLLSEVIPSAVACPSSSDCYVAAGTLGVNGDIDGDEILWTVNAGKRWHKATMGDGDSGLDAVACVTITTCYVGGWENAVYVTSDGGTTWRDASASSFGVGNVDALDCTSSTNCLAGLDEETPTLIGTHDGGTTWNNESEPTSAYALGAVACATPSKCVAVGSSSESGGAEILASTDGGTSWTPALVPEVDTSQLNDVTCSSATVCLAVGGEEEDTGAAGVILLSHDGGTTWAEASVPSTIGDIVGISCPSATVCVADGGFPGAPGAAVIESTDGGGVWSEISVPVNPDDHLGSATGVACSTVASCTFIGFDPRTNVASMIKMSDGGSTWSGKAIPSGLSTLSAIACSTPLRCDAVGSPSIGSDVVPIVTSANGGKTWALGSTSAPLNNGLDAVSCASSMDCEAVGPSGTVVQTTDGGSDWSAQAFPSAGVNLSGVACGAPDACIALGEGGPTGFPIYSLTG